MVAIRIFINSLTDTECFNTYNPENPMYTDLTVGNVYDRQWTWMLCNQPFSYWQDGAPAGTTTIVSRLVTASYWQRQCELFFPPVDGHTYGSSPSHVPQESTTTTNLYTTGWFEPLKATSNTRLLWVNGEHDPWRTSGVASQFRPGGPWQGSANAPALLIPDGFHCSDLRLYNAQANPGVQAVVNQAVAQMVKWVGEYPG